MINYLLTAYILAEIGAPTWLFVVAVFCAAVDLLFVFIKED